MDSELIQNWEPAGDGRIRVVCQWCDRRSRPLQLTPDGKPHLWDLTDGWSETGFPPDYEHRDGSLGPQYTCPACTRLRQQRQQDGITPLLAPSSRRAAVMAGRRPNNVYSIEDARKPRG